jgi:hypothetical protein
MATPNPLAPTKGAGTTLWVFTGTGDHTPIRFQMLTGCAWQRLKTFSPVN